MRVLIANAMVPFSPSKAEGPARQLRKALEAAGHEAEVLRIPFDGEPYTRIASQLLLVTGLELSGVDRVIALTFPAYLIRHPRKAVWLLDQRPDAFDPWEVGPRNLPNDATGHEIRGLIINADDEALRDAHAIYVSSDLLRNRLAQYRGIQAQVLRPPLGEPRQSNRGESQEISWADAAERLLR